MIKKHEYIVGKTRMIVELEGSDWYDYRANENETILPKTGAWCRECAAETAVPMYPIYMNGNEAYALKCKKCGSEYPMYKATYITRYVGYDTKAGGHVNPTHGKKSIYASMDRKAKDHFHDREKRVEDDLCSAFDLSHEQYQSMMKKINDDRKKEDKKFKIEQAELRAKYQNEQIQSSSAERKKLIEQGIIKYVKGIGLVDTRTGDVVKL